MNLKVDFLSQPTVAGTLAKVDPQAKAIEVRLDQAAMAEALGGPTGEDGEQAFFGMIELETPYGTQKLQHMPFRVGDSAHPDGPGEQPEAGGAHDPRRGKHRFTASTAGN
jgi:hypothetical protein